MQPLIAPEEHSSGFLNTGRKYISYNNSGVNDSSSSGTNLFNKSKDNRIWWVYESDIEIGRVIQWLNGRYFYTYLYMIYSYIYTSCLVDDWMLIFCI